MFHRIFKPLKSNSFFIFGARGTGKSTYIKGQWGEPHHYINLLLDKWEQRYSRSPDLLISDLNALDTKVKWIVIDEIQKVPKLLDIIHELIETTEYKFVMTGSSARKLKRQAANLLAGRAFDYRLFPLTHRELGAAFNLDDVLNWGSLPTTFSMIPAEKEEFLRSYCQTYLKEEILQEQIVRNGSAFRQFLEISAQENGKVLNFSKIAKDIGVDTKTAQSYFQILEDTLVGFFVPAYTRSARKSVKQQPKFFLFDLGIKKAMELSLENHLRARTSYYGYAFEHFIALEIHRLNQYYRKDYQLSHYQTFSGGEIDFILHKAKEVIAIEVKSSETINVSEVDKLAKTAEALKATSIYYISQDPTPTKVGDVSCLHWKDFLIKIFP